MSRHYDPLTSVSEAGADSSFTLDGDGSASSALMTPTHPVTNATTLHNNSMGGNNTVVSVIGASPSSPTTVGDTSATMGGGGEGSHMQQRESSLIMGSYGVGGEDEVASEVMDFSNGLRIEFLQRRGWDAAKRSNANTANATDKQGSGGGAPSSSCLKGRRVTPFADVVFDYELLKALDVKSECYAKYKVSLTNAADDGSNSNTSSSSSPIIARGDVYASFDFASDTPLASRMAVGPIYESQKDFELKFVPSYTDVSAASIYGLNMAFPYLREGDEALLFIPSYLGPSLDVEGLGDAFKAQRAYDEVAQQYVEPAAHPYRNAHVDEHSFMRLKVRHVMAEEAITEDRYITKTVIVEGCAGSTPRAKTGAGGGSDDDNTTAAADDADSFLITPARHVAVGSVVTFDIGEVNEYINKPSHYRTVKDCVVCGGSTTCEELDLVLLSMREGEYSNVKIGSTRYHMKVLDIQRGTALGEVVGDAATELARRIKDAGNAVLSAASSAATKQFSSPVRPAKNQTTMGSPMGSGIVSAATTANSAAAMDEALTAEALAAKRYFSPPCDLAPNPVLDALSTFVVRPSRSSYYYCAKSSTATTSPSTTAGGFGASSSSTHPSSSSARHHITKDSEPFATRVSDEASYRAIQLYKYAQKVLMDMGGHYYDDDHYDGGAGGHSPPTSDTPTKRNVRSTAATTSAKAQYNLEKRSELLGTVYGNCAQVYLNLGFYEEAVHAASEAITRCAHHDVYKHYFRRAKALRAQGLVKDAYDDLAKVKVLFTQYNVTHRDERYAELEREMKRCEADARQMMAA